MRLKIRGWLHRNLCGKMAVLSHIYACSEFCAAKIARDQEQDQYQDLL